MLDRPPFGKACLAISPALSRSRTGWEKTFQAVAGAGASVAWIIQVPYAAASRCALQCTARRIWKPSKQMLHGRRLQRNNGWPDNDITIGARACFVRALELTTDQTPFRLRGVSVKATKQASIKHGVACNDL